MERKLGSIFGKVKKEYLVYGLLGGILLLVIAMPVKSTDTAESDASVRSELETQLTAALNQMQYTGKVWTTITMEPYVEGRESPEIRGVLILCEHGDEPAVIREIIESVQALFQLEAHKIKVIKMR